MINEVEEQSTSNMYKVGASSKISYQIQKDKEVLKIGAAYSSELSEHFDDQVTITEKDCIHKGAPECLMSVRLN